MLAALLGFLTATAVTALAQRTPSSIQRRVEQLNRQNEQFERDNLGREATGKTGKTDRRQSQMLVAEVRKDLESLQTGYNQIVLAMAGNKSSDDPQILDAVIEIKECSIRLKHNLALPQAGDDQKKPAVAAAEPAIEAPLMTLRKHIYSFVMSPIFESPAVLNVEEAEKAGRDLDRIIELSQLISKHHVTKKSTP